MTATYNVGSWNRIQWKKPGDRHIKSGVWLIVSDGPSTQGNGMQQGSFMCRNAVIPKIYHCMNSLNSNYSTSAFVYKKDMHISLYKMNEISLKGYTKN